MSIFDDPTKPRGPASLFDRAMNAMVLFTFLRIAIMFVAPYFAYAWVRDAATNIVTPNKVYIIERNPYLWFGGKYLPPAQAGGKSTCYVVLSSVDQALNWLRSREYQVEEFNCYVDDVEFPPARKYFVKPTKTDGRYPAELESVVELVVDYGDGHTEALCGLGKVNMRGFATIDPNLLSFPSGVGHIMRHAVAYIRYSKSGSYEVVKRSNGAWYPK